MTDDTFTSLKQARQLHAQLKKNILGEDVKTYLENFLSNPKFSDNTCTKEERKLYAQYKILLDLIKERIIPEDKPKKKLEQGTQEKSILTTSDDEKPFFDKELLENVKKELSKTHLQDDNLKMTALFVGVSGLLKNPRKRMSMALTGESSTGKDNLMKTILKHMPDPWLFLTGATQPAIEDEAMYARILALSEMNLFREGGANRGLLEVVKQRTEGGTSSIKKDAVTGFKTTKHEKTEQGTTFYGTIEAERNSENETRFIFGNVEANEEKIRIVNLNTAEKVSDIDKLIKDIQETDEPSWIKKGLIRICEKYGDCEILLPYANILISQKIEGGDIIDNSDPRSMRDFKRLIALTSATTFIFAFQRKMITYKNKKILISEPEDLLSTLQYSQEFFNQTYTGMDERLNQVMKVIDSQLGNWTARDYIQRTLKKSLNTIKQWMDTLEEMGLVESKKGADLNFQENVKTYDGNKRYFKRCQKGIKKLLIRCQLSKLKELLESQKVSVDDVLSRINKEAMGVNLPDENNVIPHSSGIDTFGLTPLEKDIALSNLGTKEELEPKEKPRPMILLESVSTQIKFAGGEK